MRFAEAPQPAFDQGSVGQHPAVQGGVIDLEAALQEQLLDVTIAQGIAQVPGDRLQDQRRLEVPALEVVLGSALQLLRKSVQDRRLPPNRRPQRQPTCLTDRDRQNFAKALCPPAESSRRD